MIISGTNIHKVTSIALVRVNFGGFVSHQFAFETADGAIVEVSAFADEPLTISEAERDARDLEVLP